MQDLSGLAPGAVPQQCESQLQIDVSCHGSECVLRLGGELDVATAPQLRDTLQLVCRGEQQLIVVDLGELRFLSLAGLQVLAETHQILEIAGRRLVLSQPDALTRRVLSVTGLDELLDVTCAQSPGRCASPTTDG